MTYQIVTLTAGNSSLLESIAPNVFDHAINPVYLDNFLKDPRHVMVLAVEKGVVVGMGSGVEYFHPDKAPQLWINEIGTASSHRSKGIGRALTTALVEMAEARGCIYAWLGTDKTNLAGQACFSKVPDVEPPQDILLYEWDLED
jgi:aminoglycoside 6'-N-acetyltransferase I